VPTEVRLGTPRVEADMTKRIVAAVDSSPASYAALNWAYGEAAMTGDELLAVHVVEPANPSNPAESRDHNIAAATAQMRVLTALPCVTDVESPVRVTISAPGGALVRTLAKAACDAAMVVVGEPQSARHADLAETLAVACGCPVVAVSENYDVRHIPVP
jgi:nucleotide-binding universal stress UspA family protein